MSEVCPKQHEARGMGILTGTWGLGLVVGPAIGGLLSNPIENYPHICTSDVIGVHTVQFLTTYPYFLPNLITAMYACIDFLLVYVGFEETLVINRDKEEPPLVAIELTTLNKPSLGSTKSSSNDNTLLTVNSPILIMNTVCTSGNNTSKHKSGNTKYTKLTQVDVHSMTSEEQDEEEEEKDVPAKDEL